MLIIKIAGRNLFKHKGKSLVIGAILFIGAIIMMIGSATVSSLERTMNESFVEKFLGDITIISTNQENEAVLMNMMGDSVAVIERFPEVVLALSNRVEIRDTLPYAYSVLMTLSGSDNPTGYPSICAVFACDINRYQATFSNLTTLEGEIPPPGARGLYLSAYMREMYYLMNQEIYYPKNFPFSPKHFPMGATNAKEEEVSVKNELVLMGYSDRNATMDVSAPILGVFKYTKFHSFWRELSILDIQSYRQCMNYTMGNSEVEVDKEEAELLSFDFSNPDALFAEEPLVSSAPQKKGGDIKEILKENSKKISEVSLDEGAWELIAVRLKPEYRSQAKTILKNMNEEFKLKGLPVKAIYWETFAGSMASFLKGIRAGLYVLVGLIFIVAVIIIMNTLAMATLERSSELGMMRAIGTRRSFLGKMLLGETFTLALVFGGLGIVAGAILTTILAKMQIAVPNEMVQVITGGDVYNPLLTLRDILFGILMLGMVTVLSVIYPLIVSSKIGPLDAVGRD